MFSGRFVFYWTAIVAKYEKDRMGNKEDVSLLKKASFHENSEEYKKIYEALEGLI